MARVTGIGGIFFKARDPKGLGAWYARYLGLAIEDWGGARFGWAVDPEGNRFELWEPPREAGR